MLIDCDLRSGKNSGSTTRFIRRATYPITSKKWGRLELTVGDECNKEKCYADNRRNEDCSVSCQVLGPKRGAIKDRALFFNKTKHGRNYLSTLGIFLSQSKRGTKIYSKISPQFQDSSEFFKEISQGRDSSSWLQLFI